MELLLSLRLLRERKWITSDQFKSQKQQQKTALIKKKLHVFLVLWQINRIHKLKMITHTKKKTN